MKHSFILKQKAILLSLGMVICILYSCNQPKENTEQLDSASEEMERLHMGMEAIEQYSMQKI